MSKGHGLREESVSLFYHLRPPPIAITTASYSPPYLPAIFAQSSRNLFAIFSASFRNHVRMSSRVPQLVRKSTTAGTRPHALLHRLTKQGVWGDTPCCIVPCTLRHRPLEFRPPLPLSSSVAVRSAAVMPQPPLPAPPRPRCMQNRISKTLLTLLFLLKNHNSFYIN